jgi:uncharacterized protein (TIGR04255 family)
MPFPPAPRVIYRKNPLEMVVCQLRFPPILRIDASLPADFQERIREGFPNFSESTEFTIDTPVLSGDQIPPDLVKQAIKTSGVKNYEFSSEDGLFKINLTRTFLALSAKRYDRWENFIGKLANPFQALRDIYNPAYFSRIGLRYVDVIKRSVLNLVNVPWRELLSSSLIGMLGSPDTDTFVENLEMLQEIQLSEQNGTARIATKLAKTQEGENIFILDSDFFVAAKTNVDDAMAKLAFFNSRSTRLIRWAVTDRLHNALEPEPL